MCVRVYNVRVRQKGALKSVCAIGPVMYELKHVFILSHDEYIYIQHSIITIYP